MLGNRCRIRDVGVWFAGLAAAGVLVGCGEVDRSGERRVVVRDSAGVTIVENPPEPGRSDLGWILGPDPIVSIGSPESDDGTSLFRVVGATRIDDGRVLVANAGSSEIRVFGNAGAYLGAWGRPGEGPGEFLNLGGIGPWLADSVVAWEWTGSRLTVFDAEGQVGRTMATRVNNGEVAAPPVGVSGEGQLLVASLLSFSPADIEFGLISRDRTYALLDQDGAVLANLGGHPTGELYVPENLMVTPHPFGRGAVSTTWGVDVAIGLTHTFEIRVFDRRGELTRIVRRQHEAVPVSQSHLDDWMAGQLALTDEGERARLSMAFEGFPLVEAFPAYSAVMEDAAGHLWVKEYAMLGDDRVRWSVFDTGGALVGGLETPRSGEVLEIGQDHILTLHTDDLGVEYVRVWLLDRTARE